MQEKSGACSWLYGNNYFLLHTGFPTHRLTYYLVKYLWIGAVVLVFGLRLWLKSMRHNERQEYLHNVEEQRERYKQYTETVRKKQHPAMVLPLKVMNRSSPRRPKHFTMVF